MSRAKPSHHRPHTNSIPAAVQPAAQPAAQMKSARRQRVLIQTGAKELRKTLKPWFYLFLDMAKKIRAVPEFSSAPLHQKRPKADEIGKNGAFLKFF